MPKIKNLNQTPNFAKLEEQVLAYWQKNKSFEKSVAMRDESKSYVFYDGPPFATGLPHYGHLLASTTKDVIPRYWTMKGYRVERKWGWDCHGLPIENLIEKELDLPDKQAIENFGIDKFNEACRNRVLTYADDWQKIIARMGRWVDMNNDYKTMEPEYMESLWWVFKELWQKKLIYQGHKSMHICPRCATPLSNFEVTQGYKDVKDISVIAKFRLENPEKLGVRNKKIDILAWTTTPWTLPGNVLLAVNKNIDYVLFEASEPGKAYIAAESRLNFVLGDSKYKVIKKFKASDLANLSYEPLFPYFKKTQNAFKIKIADFVNLEEGTGIVHIAPGFGEDDYNLGKKENIDLIQHVDFNGRFTKQVIDFAGDLVKPKDNPNQTDIKIIKYLAKNDKLWDKKKVTHSYPHCWRCDTPLLNYATSSWFVAVTKIKNDLLKNNQKINWLPEHIKNGRFGMWLEGARDWSISRNRYWGTPLPVWQNEDGDTICVGSRAELEKLSGQKITDLHKDVIDKIKIKYKNKTYTRISEVLDCWFESGAMPYGSFHYPFENKQKFEKNFPAEFISEGQDQTRGWFYTLHVLATALTTGDKPSLPVQTSSSSFKNVIVNGIVLAEDGKKMSKRLKNYPDPMELVDKYGVDTLRLYLMSSSVMKAENLNFSEKEVADLRRKVFMIWFNVFKFYKLFAKNNLDITQAPAKPEHILDQWLLSKLNKLILKITKYMDGYDVVKASRELINFISDLSNWYLRLSRDRLKAKNNSQASQTLGYVLFKLAQLYAPFAPFFTETLYHNLIDENKSIHHTDWPAANKKLINQNLEQEMATTRKIAELAHALRKEKNIKVRQPLFKLTVTGPELKFSQELSGLLQREINLKAVIWVNDSQTDLEVELDTKLTPELKAEGEARELMRAIQNLRRKAGLKPDELVTVSLPGWPKKWEEKIANYTHTKLVKGEQLAIK